MREWIQRSCAKFVGASFAGTNFAQMLKAENSGRMAVGEIDLEGIATHRGSRASRNFRLVHGQNCRGKCAGKLANRGCPLLAGFGFFRAFIIAQRAGTLVAKVRKVIVARVAIGPLDVHARARRDVHLDLGRFLSRVQWNRHWYLSISDPALPS